jgi:hypothetical protein
MGVDMWWPELTVDVVQSDLQRISKSTRRMSTESVPEDIESYEWSVKPEKGSKSSRFDSVVSRMSIIENKIERFRNSLSMTSFHATHVRASNGRMDEQFVSPIEYCEGTRVESVVPSSAQSIREYMDLMKQLGSTICVNVTTLLLREVQSTNNYQDIRDIQRDSVSVNGEMYLGSQVGYDKIVNSIAKRIKSTSDVEEIAKRALSIANRTFSGGIAFDNVISTFSAENIVMVVPVSAEADPLDITVVDRPDASPSVLIRAHTKYRLESVTDGHSVGTVDACMLAELCVDRLGSDSRAFVFLDTTYS